MPSVHLASAQASRVWVREEAELVSPAREWVTVAWASLVQVQQQAARSEPVQEQVLGLAAEPVVSEH